MIYDTIIIGAGVAGLSAGLELSRSGRKALLVEKQAVPGGVAAGFSRKGFSFESALHCVDGLQEGGDIMAFLEKSGIRQRVSLIGMKEFSRVIYPGCDQVTGFEKDKLISSLTASFPGEAEGLRRLFAELDRFYSEFDNFNTSRLPSWLKYLFCPLFYPTLLKASRITASQLVARHIPDKKLEAIITDIWRFTGSPPSRLSAVYFLLVFQGYYYHQVFQVQGGFARLFKVMVDKIRENGAEVKFNTRVEKIISRQADKGGSGYFLVRTDKEEEFKARCVISNANPIDTLTRFIDDASLRDWYTEKLSPMVKTLSAFQVYLGLKTAAKNLGMRQCMFSLNTSYDPDENFAYCLNGDYSRCPLILTDHAQLDPQLVPAGKGGLLIMTLDDYARWQGLRREEYLKKKEAAAEQLIRRVEQYLPGLSANIEVKEIATPLTMERFGAAPEGAIYGFTQTLEQSGDNRLSQKTKLPGLFLAGGWTWPGAGVHACVISGLQAAKLAGDFLKNKS